LATVLSIFTIAYSLIQNIPGVATSAAFALQFPKSNN
jgi:hypothetical protein